MRKVLILGAASAIAEETAKCFAQNGDALFLAGRNREKLKSLAGELKEQGAVQVETDMADLSRFENQETLLQKAWETMGGIDTAILAYAELPDHERSRHDLDYALAGLQTNFTSTVSWIHRLANRFEVQGSGAIVFIGSIAGDRGRRRNYHYGTAKAAVETYLQGVRCRLDQKGIHVLTVKPGYVDTPMTAHLKKNALFASPDSVGKGIYRALERRKDVVYMPWFWRWIMLLIRIIPEGIFKKINI